jgi:hypothetical protein
MYSLLLTGKREPRSVTQYYYSRAHSQNLQRQHMHSALPAHQVQYRPVLLTLALWPHLNQKPPNEVDLR